MNLRYGSRGSNVKDLQTRLKKYGFNSGSIDGIYGNKTAGAVKSFQKKYGLAVDGIAGNNTFGKLNNLNTPRPKVAPKPAAKTTVKKPTTVSKKPAASNGFNFKYNALTYGNALKQANNQLDPTYNQALTKIKQQRYQDQLDSGEVAASRGLAHSGLAADQLNKVGIAASQQMADVGAEKSGRASEIAQSLIDRDINSQNSRFNQSYQQYRDKITDGRYNEEFKYRKYRDEMGDKQSREALSFEKQKFKSETDWRRHVYTTMSASEKAQFEINKQQFGETMAWNIEESNRANKLSRDQMEFQAGQSGFLAP